MAEFANCTALTATSSARLHDLPLTPSQIVIPLGSCMGVTATPRKRRPLLHTDQPVATPHFWHTIGTTRECINAGLNPDTSLRYVLFRCSPKRPTRLHGLQIMWGSVWSAKSCSLASASQWSCFLHFLVPEMYLRLTALNIGRLAACNDARPVWLPRYIDKAVEFSCSFGPFYQLVPSHMFMYQNAGR